jgi:hypothetical protein
LSFHFPFSIDSISPEFTDIIFHDILCEIKDSLPHSKEAARQHLIEKVSPFISSHTPVPSVLSGLIGVNWPKKEDHESDSKTREDDPIEAIEGKGKGNLEENLEKEEKEEEGGKESLDNDYMVQRAFYSVKKYFNFKKDEQSPNIPSYSSNSGKISSNPPPFPSPLAIPTISSSTSSSSSLSSNFSPRTDKRNASEV